MCFFYCSCLINPSVFKGPILNKESIIDRLGIKEKLLCLYIENSEEHSRVLRNDRVEDYTAEAGQAWTTHTF